MRIQPRCKFIANGRRHRPRPEGITAAEISARPTRPDTGPVTGPAWQQPRPA